MSRGANWFVGLPMSLEERVRSALEGPPRGVRLFHPDDVHLTVAFLGSVDEPRARAAFAACLPFPLAPLVAPLGTVKPLGNPRRPSAISALVDVGHDALAEAMRARRDLALAAAGLPPERREALPHVTLARVGRKASPAEHREALAWARSLDVRGATARVDRIALFTWNEDRASKLFRIVDERPLEAPGVSGS